MGPALLMLSWQLEVHKPSLHQILTTAALLSSRFARRASVASSDPTTSLSAAIRMNRRALKCGSSPRMTGGLHILVPNCHDLMHQLPLERSNVRFCQPHLGTAMSATTPAATAQAFWDPERSMNPSITRASDACNDGPSSSLSGPPPLLEVFPSGDGRSEADDGPSLSVDRGRTTGEDVSV